MLLTRIKTLAVAEHARGTRDCRRAAPSTSAVATSTWTGACPLREGGTHRWQPSPTLATALWRHATTRGDRLT